MAEENNFRVKTRSGKTFFPSLIMEASRAAPCRWKGEERMETRQPDQKESLIVIKKTVCGCLEIGFPYSMRI